MSLDGLVAIDHDVGAVLVAGDARRRARPRRRPRRRGALHDPRRLRRQPRGSPSLLAAHARPRGARRLRHRRAAPVARLLASRPPIRCGRWRSPHSRASVTPSTTGFHLGNPAASWTSCRLKTFNASAARRGRDACALTTRRPRRPPRRRLRAARALRLPAPQADPVALPRNRRRRRRLQLHHDSVGADGGAGARDARRVQGADRRVRAGRACRTASRSATRPPATRPAASTSGSRCTASTAIAWTRR